MVEVVVVGEKYDLVIRKRNERYGYKIDFLALQSLKESRFHKIDFEINQKNELSVLRIDSLKFDSSTNQPNGFPLSPILLTESQQQDEIEEDSSGLELTYDLPFSVGPGRQLLNAGVAPPCRMNVPSCTLRMRTSAGL